MSFVMTVDMSFAVPEPLFDDDILVNLVAQMFPGLNKSKEEMDGGELIGEILLEKMEVVDGGKRGNVTLSFEILVPD